MAFTGKPQLCSKQTGAQSFGLNYAGPTHTCTPVTQGVIQALNLLLKCPIHHTTCQSQHISYVLNYCSLLDSPFYPLSMLSIVLTMLSTRQYDVISLLSPTPYEIPLPHLVCCTKYSS